MRENAGNQVVIGFSFGGEFLDQSQSSPGLLSTFDWKLLPRHNRGRSVFFPHVHVLLVLLCQVYMFAQDQQNALLVPFALIPSWSQCESCHLKDAYSSSFIKQPIRTNCLIVVRDNGNSFRGFSVLHCASCTAHKNHVIRQISARLLQEHGIIS